MIVALGLIAAGWLSLPTLLLAVMTELLTTVALAWHFYPQRGLRRHLLDVTKMLALVMFLSIFILGAYAGAGGFVHSIAPAPQELFGVAVLVVIRGGLLLLQARAAPDPRLYWAGSALMRGGALVVGSALAAFTCFLPGVLLAGLLAQVWPTQAADLVIAAIYLITLGVMACIVSTMSERELAEIAGQPYLDR